jgi:hypothetical protein
MTLERKAELIEAMNRDCVPGCENCRRNRVKAILSALKEVRAEALAEKTTNGLPGSTAGANPEGSAPVAALVATWRKPTKTWQMSRPARRCLRSTGIWHALGTNAPTNLRRYYRRRTVALPPAALPSNAYAFCIFLLPRRRSEASRLEVSNCAFCWNDSGDACRSEDPHSAAPGRCDDAVGDG